MTSNSSSSPESTLALGDNQATYLCLLPFSLASSDMPLFIEYEPFCLSLTTPYHISSHSNGTHLTAIAKYQVSPNFLRGAWGRQPQICVQVSLSHSICQHAGLGHASLSQRDPYSAKGTGQALSQCICMTSIYPSCMVQSRGTAGAQWQVGVRVPDPCLTEFLQATYLSLQIQNFKIFNVVLN